jgi:hypothetical protein
VLTEVAIAIHETDGKRIGLVFMALPHNPLTWATARAQHQNQRGRASGLEQKSPTCIETQISAVVVAACLAIR